MPRYRLVTASSSAAPPRVIHCADDMMAIQVARQLIDGHAIEIWHDTRLVDRLEPK
jgi:hypothetical protein